MLLENFYVSGNDTVLKYGNQEPKWKVNTWNKDNWENDNAYWYVFYKKVGNRTYWYIQYGFDGKPFASVKFQYFYTDLENLKTYEDNRISFTVKYYFTYLCNRECTSNNGGYDVHNEYWLGDDNVYSLDYNTASSNTWDNENSPLYYRRDYTLNPGEELELKDVFKIIFDYKGVVPNSTFYMGIRYKNNLPTQYYPGYLRKDKKLIDNGFIKNRLITFDKDNRLHQNEEDYGHFRYRKNGKQFQINEVK